MASTPAPPKSVLKTSIPATHAASSSLASEPGQTSAPPGQRPQQRQKKETPQKKPGPDPRHLAIAMHHAHRIQAQKDAEALILNRILELTSFPSSPTADPACPSPSDAEAFKSAIVPFQPSDYDNLILERNIEGLCGYALCPREHRKEDPKAKYRILWGAKGSGPGGRGREMKVVPREKLEMWCSEECAERAMYVRVQLAEDPVWERRADDTRGKNILLLEEARAMKKAGGKGNGKGKEAGSTTVREVTDGMRRLDIDGGNESAEMGDKMDGLVMGDSNNSSRQLALERGDSHPAFQAGRVDVQIVEKDNSPSTHVTAPTLRPEDRNGGSIEGYIPKERHTARGVEDDDDDDDDDDILDHL